jgi:sec-independent protein translocase protein TatA
MNIFGVGIPEIAVIFVLALLIFGPKKLPELGRSIGKTLKSFQQASGEFQKEIEKAVKETDEEVINDGSEVFSDNSLITANIDEDEDDDD